MVDNIISQKIDQFVGVCSGWLLPSPYQRGTDSAIETPRGAYCSTDTDTLKIISNYDEIYQTSILKQIIWPLFYLKEEFAKLLKLNRPIFFFIFGSKKMKKIFSSER